MNCKGCNYLDWKETQTEPRTIYTLVTYICMHSMAKGEFKIAHRKGYIISTTNIVSTKLKVEIGNVEQSLWCPLMDEGDLYG